MYLEDALDTLESKEECRCPPLLMETGNCIFLAIARLKDNMDKLTETVQQFDAQLSASDHTDLIARTYADCMTRAGVTLVTFGTDIDPKLQVGHKMADTHREQGQSPLHCSQHGPW